MKRLEISAELRGQIESHAEGEYPLEACGLLLGEVEGEIARARRVLKLQNTHGEDRRHRYQATKEEFRQAERICEMESLQMLGVYHSHPDSPPSPSRVDAEFAFPGWIYWISRVDAGKAALARAWLRSENADAWDEIAIVTLGEDTISPSVA